jgi:hypothetical protein
MWKLAVDGNILTTKILFILNETCRWNGGTFVEALIDNVLKL